MGRSYWFECPKCSYRVKVSGRAEVAPYRKGAAIACDQCSYRSICRIDPWTHQFRVLRSAD